MRIAPLPALTRGLDVMAPETALPKGSARTVSNVTLYDDGGFARRPGHTPTLALAGTRSLWRSRASGRTYVAVGAGLYEVNLDTPSVTQVFDGLMPHAEIEYAERGDEVWFCAPNVLGKITAAGLVRRPGVANLLGYRPTLTAAAAGGLTAGTYGVAYSLLNDLGEESGVSSIAWIELATGGGITLTGLQTASHVATMNIWVTAPNGRDLYLHSSMAAAGSATIADQKLSSVAAKVDLDPMPGGDIVRHYNGRTYVASGPWLWISEAFDPGLMNIKSGWLSFGQDINVLEPVNGGIFVGLSERTIFLRGSGPEDFVHVPVSAHGAAPHSGMNAPGDFFDSELVPEQGATVAVWLSNAGLVIGRAGGALLYPQADRLRLDVTTSARPLVAQRRGVKQAVFCLESLNLGVGAAVDSTI